MILRTLEYTSPLLMLFQQLTSINAIIFYAETIFEEAHFKNSNVATVVVVVAAIKVVFTAVAALVMDRAGRKLLIFQEFLCA